MIFDYNHRVTPTLTAKPAVSKFLIHGNYEMINIYLWFKPLKVGVICYTAIYLTNSQLRGMKILQEGISTHHSAK